MSICIPTPFTGGRGSNEAVPGLRSAGEHAEHGALSALQCAAAEAAVEAGSRPARVGAVVLGETAAAAAPACGGGAMTASPLRVFISGPYTHGDQADNVRNACLAALAVMKAGHAPFCPHLFHFLHFLEPHSYVEWCALDLHWLTACHMVLRLPGESPGSDREVDAAKQLGLPVYYSLAECMRALPTRELPGT
jgi:hypothetical protein